MMKPLQYKNFEHLNAATDVKLSKDRIPQLLKFFSRCDMLKEAEKHLASGDHEHCYITLIKYISMVEFIKKHAQPNSSFWKKEGPNCLKAVVFAERVSEELKVMYSEKNQKLLPPIEKKEDEKPIHKISSTEYFNIKALGKANCLIMDAREESDFKECHIGSKLFIANVISIPAEIIERGKSAQSLENALPAASLTLWRNRNDYDKIIVLDWDAEIGGKGDILRSILTTYDRYENKEVLLLAFEEWYENYPWTLSNPLVKNSEPSPTTPLNLDSIIFDSLDFGDEDAKPRFDRSKKPQSSTIPSIDRSTKNAMLDIGELLKEKELKMREIVEKMRTRLRAELELENEHQRQKEAQFDQEREAILIKEEEKLLKEINSLKEDVVMKDDKIREFEEMIAALNLKPKSNEEVNIEKNIVKHTEEAKRLKEECDNLELNRLTQEARSRPKPNYNIQKVPQRPEINRSTKPVTDSIPIVGKTRGLTGLKNLGNTCYMNSILQCISNNPLLASYFLHRQYNEDLNKSHHKTRGQVAEEVANVVKTLWSGQTPKTVGAIKSEYRACEQQDSHEFLTFLMDWLHNDLKRESVPFDGIDVQNEMEKSWQNFIEKNHSFITEKFYGLQKSTITCSRCNFQSATFEPFSNLSLTIPDGDYLDLSTCLKLYLRGEQISGWKCPKCKEQRQAVKKTDFCRLPKVLVIHLKRFCYQDVHFKKKTTFVNFPVSNLILTDVDNDITYNLYGVSNHYGTMEGGHYTAYCENPILKKWFKFDDHEVTQLTPRDVVTNAAYILFYKES